MALHNLMNLLNTYKLFRLDYQTCHVLCAVNAAKQMLLPNGANQLNVID